MTHAPVGGTPVAKGSWRRQAVRIWLLLAGLFLALSVLDIYRVSFPDPDDALRLAQVRDLIAGQGWFDLHQYRIDPLHGGVLMHWSRLVDMPLAALILLLRPLIGQGAAEVVTMIVVPLLILGGVLASVCRLAYLWLGERTAFYSCVALALSVPAIQQMRPMRIDHHGWQMLLTMLAVSALFTRSPRWGGLFAGAALAIGLSISLEGLPMAAALVGVTALRWLRDRAERGWTLYAMLALGVLSPLLFVATRGTGDLTLHCDIITPVHLTVFAWGTLGVAALAAVNPRNPVMLIGGFAAIGGVALAVALGAAPECASGAFGQLDPLTRALWYERVHEGLPLWRQTGSVMAGLVIGPLVGLWAAVRLMRAAPTPERRREWLEYSLLLGAAIAISFLVARAGGVAGMLAAVPLGWILERWVRAAVEQAHIGRKAIAFAALLVTLVPAGPVALASAMLPEDSGKAGDYIQLARRAQGCSQDRMPASIAQLPPGRVLAPLDLGPELIADTRMSVVGTGHHRGNQSMRAVIFAFLAPPEAAHARVLELKADYLIACPKQTEVLNYRYLRPRGLAGNLSAGRVPAWLEPVKLPETTKFKVWRVKR